MQKRGGGSLPFLRNGGPMRASAPTEWRVDEGIGPYGEEHDQNEI